MQIFHFFGYAAASFLRWSSSLRKKVGQNSGRPMSTDVMVDRTTFGRAASALAGRISIQIR